METATIKSFTSLTIAMAFPALLVAQQPAPAPAPATNPITTAFKNRIGPLSRNIAARLRRSSNRASTGA